MARIRTIKPELPSDRTLAACSIPARYTFLLCIAQADDYGLLLAEPRQLLGVLYPHDDAVTGEQLVGWLHELVTAGRVRWRHTTDGARVIEIVNWSKHQLVKNPGKPLLRNRLRALADEPPETIRQSSGNPPPNLPPFTGGLGGAERDRERERERERERDRERETRAREEQPAPDSLAGILKESRVRSHVPEEHLPAFDDLLRASHNPAAFLGAVEMLPERVRGATWDHVGQALTDLTLAGKPATGKLLLAFTHGAMTGEARHGNGATAHTALTTAMQEGVRRVKARQRGAKA